MSEYQYYDFRAIDKPLTSAQKSEVSSLSSRAQITSRRAEFTYNYGDFRGNEKRLMADTFDMMLHVANWGTKRLIFRLPKAFFDVSQCRDYFISDEIDHENAGAYTILDLHFNEEEVYSDWIDGEELLDDLLPLRDELIQGDYRVLYLAWLKAAEKSLHYGDIDDEALEPLVPPGLQNLSPAQQAFAELIELSEVYIQAAAENSPSLQQSAFNPEAWLGHLTDDDKADYLLRLCRNESNLALTLQQQLKSLYLANEAKGNKFPNNRSVSRRTIGELMMLWEEHQQETDKEAEHKARIVAERNRQIAAQDRKLYLDQLSRSKNAVWKEVDRLVQLGQAKSYDQATTHLCDLQELATRESESAEFEVQLQALVSQYTRRRKFIERLQRNKLLTD